jgi:hypothetical protein
MFCWSRSTHGDPNFKPVVLIRKWKMACHCQVDYFTKLSNLSDKRGMECNWNYWNRWKTMVVHVAISKLVWLQWPWASVSQHGFRPGLPGSNTIKHHRSMNCGCSLVKFSTIKGAKNDQCRLTRRAYLTLNLWCHMCSNSIPNTHPVCYWFCPPLLPYRVYSLEKLPLMQDININIYIYINLSLSFSSACVKSIWLKSLMFQLPFLHAFVLQKSSVIPFRMSQASHFHMIPMIGDMWNPERKV